MQSLKFHPRYALPVALLLAGNFAAAPTLVLAGSVGSVSVMEVEEVGDSATISRAKAKNRSESGVGGGGGFSSSGDSCSDLNIGNVKTGVGQPVPRSVTIVIEGPVVQENKCR